MQVLLVACLWLLLPVTASLLQSFTTPIWQLAADTLSWLTQPFSVCTTPTPSCLPQDWYDTIIASACLAVGLVTGLQLYCLV